MLADGSESGQGSAGGELCGAGVAMLSALNEAGCEAKQLASLLEVLGDHLDQAPCKIDPLRTAELAADGLRIAQQFTIGLSGRAFDAEGGCCRHRASD